MRELEQVQTLHGTVRAWRWNVQSPVQAHVLLFVVVVVGGFFAGWWGGRSAQAERDAVATAGRAGAERARDVAAQMGEKTAQAAKTAQEVLSDGSLTAKIKAKMALDDSVKALDLNVDTVDGVVTVRGKVRTSSERDRATGAGARDQRRPPGRSIA